MPRGGSLPQRSSIGSHQSVRVMHRSQSTKSHRRTGSRAEAKRASMLSRHTAFSSPMVSPTQRTAATHAGAIPPFLASIHQKYLYVIIRMSCCWGVSSTLLTELVWPTPSPHTAGGLLVMKKESVLPNEMNKTTEQDDNCEKAKPNRKKKF